jgi:hypothetical protein
MEKILNKKIHYLGKLCVRNHCYDDLAFSIRLISNNTCITCNKEYIKTPLARERIKNYYSNPEIKKRRQEWGSSAENKERRKRYRQRPEVINHLKLYKSNYYQKNKEKLIKEQSEYGRTSERKKYHKDYYQRPVVKLRSNKYQKNRRKTIPRIKLNHSLSNAIRKSLLIKKAGRRWEEVVGWTLNSFMEKMDRLFEKNGPNKLTSEVMSWTNYGYGLDKWNIDHVRPLSLFDFKTCEDLQFKEAWSLDNLQPLWQYDNFNKSDKY